MIKIGSHTISVQGLGKRFGRLRVLDGLDLEIEAGKITAVLGPNGSGKTTLIKCLLGLVRPDAGHLFFDGQKLGVSGAYRARIGYMPQAARFPENLTGAAVVAMLKALREHPGALDEELFEAFGLDAEMDKPVRTLSGGTRQKLSAALAFLFDPDFLILDEPTAGLDPIASSLLKDKIQAAKARGKTFLLTSHIMSEVEELADDVAFLHNGRVRFAGPAEVLKQRTGQARLERAIAQMIQEAAA